MIDLSNHIFKIKDDHSFERIALQVFQYQIEHIPIYNSYCREIGILNPTSLNEIPFLPIEFFKTKDIFDNHRQTQITFKSSGTLGRRSQHMVSDLTLYEKSLLSFYTEQIGDPKKQVIMALLPSYLESGESSLVYMVNKLMKESGDSRSKFILSDMGKIEELYNGALADEKEPVLFGVSYALMDLSRLDKKYPKLKIIETGGMKGRRKEITKRELHSFIQEHVEPATIFSEYGMTEILSQAYSQGPSNFKTPKWMRVLIREVDDPYSFEKLGKIGGINIIDLANIYSCSFIETQDLGKVHEDGTFDILGRFDHSDIRGCNLLVQ